MSENATTSEQLRGFLSEELGKLRSELDGQYKARLDALEKQLKEAHDEREVSSRRAAIYGNEMRSDEMSKAERKRYLQDRIGNTARAIAQTYGDVEKAASLVEKRYKDERTAAYLRSQIEGDFTLGGALVETTYADDFIELLYPMARVRSLVGASLPMDNGNLTIQKMTSGTTATYGGETQNAQQSTAGFGQLVLSAKKLTALVPISNELLNDTSGRVNSYIVSDIGRRLSLREDLAFLRGDGTSHTPRGILNAVASSNVIASGTAGESDSLAAILATIRSRLNSADLPMITPAILMNAAMESKFFNARDATGTGAYLWRDEMTSGRIMGMRYVVSNQIPSNLGAGDDTEIYAGDWSQAVIADTASVQFDSSREATYWDGSSHVSAFATDQTVVKAISRHDFGLRYDNAFVVVKVDLSAVTTD